MALFTPVSDESVGFKWPSCKNPVFWSKCAEAVASTTGMPRREHPRASSTDDVEGFIAHLHDQLGDVFDHKQFLEQEPKFLNEFNKKIDPDLPFYY